MCCEWPILLIHSTNIYWAPVQCSLIKVLNHSKPSFPVTLNPVRSYPGDCAHVCFCTNFCPDDLFTVYMPLWKKTHNFHFICFIF